MAGKTQYKNTWQKENVDRVNLTMPKGKKDEIKAHAEAQGESVNGFINRAIDNQISQDRRKSPCEAVGSTEEEKVVSTDTLKAAQEAAEAVGESIPQFLDGAVTIQAQRDQTALKMGITPATGGKLDKGE